ncbi:MAG: DUF3887 domain-containing protein [Cytophagales bacterium]|nr:DUF3887 domain-containing protein [Cytophagales bacterium]
MKFLTTTIVTLLAFSCVSQPMEDRATLVEITEGITLNLSEGEFEKVRETFDANMKSALTAAQLKQVWDGLVAQAGAYKETGTVTSKILEGYRTIYQILKFENAPCKLKVVFGESKEVIGLFLIPVNAE